MCSPSHAAHRKNLQLDSFPCQVGYLQFIDFNQRVQPGMLLRRQPASVAFLSDEKVASVGASPCRPLPCETARYS
jgi:hypothetical protein